MRPPMCRWPTRYWCRSGGPAWGGLARKDGRQVTSAAIYARVSSARQKKGQTIGSQTQAVRGHARRLGLEVPEGWVFEDEGHSGATLARPALEALRDLAAQGCVDAILCYSPDRLARKFAYQALLIEEFNRAGARVEFVNGPRGDSPEDQLLVQFQGMFAEYERYADIGIALVRGIHLTGLCQVSGSPGPGRSWALDAWWVTSPGGRGRWLRLALGVSDQVPVAHRIVADGEFEHAVQDQAPAAGPAPVEAEAELVQVALQVLVLDRALVGAQQPALGQGGDPVHPGQQLAGILAAGAGGPLAGAAHGRSRAR